MSRPTLKLWRRKNAGTNWNEEWEEFLRNFLSLRKEMNSQQQKRSTRLRRQLISIEKEIENLRDQLTPTTPLEVKEQRKQEETTQLQEIEKQVSTATELFDKATQLWIRLEEDPQVQRWDQEEERINTAIQELKQRYKTIPILEQVKGTQEINKM
jgi:hypothetical protein